MNNKPNYSKGNRREIVYLLLNLGILPYPSIRVLSKSEGSLNRTHQTIRKMEAEQMIERKKLKNTRYGSQFLTLKNFEKNKDTLAEYIPKECIEYYQSTHKAQIYTTWIDSNAKGMRKINEAYLGAMMYGAGFDTFVDQDGNDCKYYNSKELKKYLHYGDDVSVLDGERKVSFTKGYGVAVSPGGNYMSYMTWHNTLPRISEGEYKLKNMTSGIVRQLGINDTDIEGLVFVNNMQSISPFLDINNMNKAEYKRLMVMLSIYPSVYILPYDKNGREHLKLMSQPLWKEKLVKEATGEYQNTNNVNYSCHHYDSNTDVGTLVFCVPDIGMLMSFYMAANRVRDRHLFQIICFDYQLPFVKKVCGGLCDIYTTSLKEYCKN